jgi:bud site selection protein 31
MAWRLRAKLRGAPAGADAVADALDEFEARMREATAAPRGDATNTALTWPVHKLHYQKNRYLHDARYVHGTISDALLRHLVREKIADGPLLAKWRKPGYDTVCSLAVLTRSNTNFGTVGICRTPLRDRVGQIMPNVQTGCVCCVSGSGGPIWWDDPVPDIVKEQILDVDPGKAHLFEEGGVLAGAASAPADGPGGGDASGKPGADAGVAEDAVDGAHEAEEEDDGDSDGPGEAGRRTSAGAGAAVDAVEDGGEAEVVEGGALNGARTRNPGGDAVDDERPSEGARHRGTNVGGGEDEPVAKRARVSERHA